METENTPKEVILTDAEQKQLEEYKGDNTFLKSLSEKYKEYGKLTERQILAFRNQGTKKPSLDKCPNTSLELKQECLFSEAGKVRKVKITSIREKALCMFDETNNQYAWVPSKALLVEEYYDENTGEPKQGLKLQDWFTRNDDFWKESRPMQSSSPKTEPVQASGSETSSVEVTPEISSDETAEDDGLPF